MRHEVHSPTCKVPMIKATVIGVLVCLVLAPSFKSVAQTIEPKFQSVFILGIARKVDWTSGSGNFRIGVVGKNSALIKELTNLATSKKLNDRTIKVEKLSSISEVGSQDIIFLAKSNSGQLKTLLSKVGTNTLVMTAHSKAISDGSHLNFLMKGNKVCFELNKTALEKTNLKFSEALVKLALAVK